MLKLRPAARFLRRLWHNERGNFAMIFAIIAIPLFGIVGLGIDLTRAYIAQTRLQGAVDNSALAAAGLSGQSDSTIQTVTKKFFYSNYHADFWAPPATPTVTIANGTVHVTATATVPNFFLVLFGYDQFNIASAADAVGQAHGLEVVMVLDITSSMIIPDPSKLPALKTASKQLIDILFGNDTSPQYLKIGIVPFTGSVKVDPNYAVTHNWIDTTGASSVARLNFDNSVPNNYAYAMLSTPSGPGYMSNTSWTGCLEARPTPTSGAHIGVHLAETDDPPDSSDPDTLWVPFFAPDSPDPVGFSTFNNNYLPDGTNGTPFAEQDRSQKYVGKSANTTEGTLSTSGVTGVNQNCVASAILPLTNDKSALINKINGLQADGYTHIPLGVAWGWRVLSPGEPFTEGHAYSDTEWDKVLIIETDGCNTMPPTIICGSKIPDGSVFGSQYSAYGFAYQKRLGTTMNTTTKIMEEEDNSMARICDNIKAVKRPDGSPAIKIYTIGFGEEATQSDIQTLLTNCATSEEDHFDAPSKADLAAAFTAIGNSLSNIRLTK